MSEERELLKRALEAIEYAYKGHRVAEEIRAYLEVKPEADKPSAWMHPNGGVIQTRLTGLDRDTYTIPLYTRFEPSRKPLSDIEIADAFYTSVKVVDSQLAAFAEGFRQAEKHHGTTE